MFFTAANAGIVLLSPHRHHLSISPYRDRFLPLTLAVVGWILMPVTPALAQQTKMLPPEGKKITAQQRQDLQKQLEEIDKLLSSSSVKSSDAALPQVRVLTRAVRLALQQNHFYKKNDVGNAGQLLELASQRARRWQAGDTALRLMGIADTNTAQRTLAVGGFVSKLDGSVQPFGLVLPPNFDPARQQPYRLDVWLHGRGDSKLELQFLTERQKSVGQYAPDDTIVLHPFGRHCNAFKFAGEIDVYEAIDAVGRLLPIDENRTSIRGFSMGGAGCWHLAVHDPGHWFAANPGAGFADTVRYQKWDGPKGPPYEINDIRQRLMHWYDADDWVVNLKNTKTVAYSGEVDGQKLAADTMIAAAEEMGFEIPHIIGEKMGHKINAESVQEISSQMGVWAAEGRPRKQDLIDMVTYTLRYNTIDWLTVEGLQQHWKQARVRAQIGDDDKITVFSKNVTHLRIQFQPGQWTGSRTGIQIAINGRTLRSPDAGRDGSLLVDLIDVPGRGWLVSAGPDRSLRKRPGVQGPIDDAFMGPVLFVKPSRPCTHGVVQRWVDAEMKYAMDRWQKIMRGKVNVVRDSELTDEHKKNYNLICFGDFSGNRYLSQLRGLLPFRWDRDALVVAGKQHNPSTHALVGIYPNPESPDRYIVINSGMTFR
ncbi:MAG: hypothetical protein AAFP69_11950, partial [Planctomycetota bacterium]